MPGDVFVDAREILHEEDAWQWFLPADAGATGHDFDVSGDPLPQADQGWLDLSKGESAAEGEGNNVGAVCQGRLRDVLSRRFGSEVDAVRAMQGEQAGGHQQAKRMLFTRQCGHEDSGMSLRRVDGFECLPQERGGNFRKQMFLKNAKFATRPGFSHGSTQGCHRVLDKLLQALALNLA